MTTARSLWPAVLVTAAALCATTTRAETGTTVPLIIEDGRPLVELTVTGPDGASAQGRFLVDTGGGAFLVPEDLAVAAGITWTETMTAEGQELARPESLPNAQIAGLALPLVAERTLVAIGRDVGLLPAHILAQHHVIFDYPARRFTLAAPGSLEPIGEAMAMPVSQPMGFPRTEIEIGGERVGMLLDTGPPATIMSEVLVDRWTNEQPDWARHDGAFGVAEALQRAGGQVLGTLVAEDVRWAGFEVGPVTLAAQREGVFETWMSRMMSAPIVGALGSNVFKDFRIELDYMNETLYVSRPARPTQHD